MTYILRNKQIWKKEVNGECVNWPHTQVTNIEKEMLESNRWILSIFKEYVPW